MGYINQCPIELKWANANKQFTFFSASIFNMCCPRAFHSAYFYLIRAGKNIPLYICIHVHVFLGETQNGMKNLFSVS